MNTNDLDLIDKAMSSGSKSVFNRDSQPGDVAEGYILRAQCRQILEYGTQTPATFPSGGPKLQTILTIQTEHQDDADDDGTRSVYIKMWGTQKRALFDAIKRAGATKASEIIQKGNYFKATYLGEERKQGKGGPYREKQYQYELRQANFDVDQALAANQQAAGNPWNDTQPAQHQPVQQPVQQAYQPTQPTLQQPAQQPVQQPVQQPLQQPAQQAAQPVAGIQEKQNWQLGGGLSDQQVAQGEQIRRMIGVGLSDQQIAQALGIDPTVVAQYR